VAAGDLVGAREAANELARVAAAFASKALTAGAAMADGRVRLATGDMTGAQQAFETAVQLWSLVGARHEVAVARSGLAEADRAAEAQGSARLESGPTRSPVEARPIDDSQRSPNAFRLDGDYWSISFQEHTSILRDLKGMHYLARLLAHPGREFHVLDLVASGVAPSATSPVASAELTSSGWEDSGVLLDAQAKNAYRRRLAEIDEDLDDARLTGDSGRVGQAQAERDFLIRELSRAVGLSGRGRRAGSASERARVSVTRAVRHAMSRIRKHDPSLGEHLERAIRTGTYCVYLPDTRITTSWKI